MQDTLIGPSRPQSILQSCWSSHRNLGIMAVHTMTSQLLSSDALAARSFAQRSSRPFTAAPTRSRQTRIACQAEQKAATTDRRQLLQLASLLAATQLARPAQAAKLGGFVPVKDQGDAYQFLYPFGWQEVSIGGQDVVYKDVIEPLESVSVSIVPSEKDDITLYGDPAEVAYSLADKVLTPPSQEVKVLRVSPRSVEGRNYVEFEFAAKGPTYIRLAIAVVTVANGKLYTLVTGANERRFNKIKSNLETVAKSFMVSTKYDEAS